MPVAPTTVPSVAEALQRMGGMFGAAYRDGKMLTNVVEVSGSIEINRVEMPITGRTQLGYKPGRESREGTLRLQKVDSYWEMEVYRFLSASLEDRRAARNAGQNLIRPFQLLLEYDDPDALGIEKWQIDGCLLWRMQLGFAITDDVVEREIPLTWERESPIYAFERDELGSGMAVARYYDGLAPPWA
jgi:hypothetical protein